MKMQVHLKAICVRLASTLTLVAFIIAFILRLTQSFVSVLFFGCVHSNALIVVSAHSLVQMTQIHAHTLVLSRVPIFHLKQTPFPITRQELSYI